MFYIILVVFHYVFFNAGQDYFFILWDKLGENKICPGIYNAASLAPLQETHHPTILMHTDCTSAC